MNRTDVIQAVRYMEGGGGVREGAKGERYTGKWLATSRHRVHTSPHLIHWNNVGSAIVVAFGFCYSHLLPVNKNRHTHSHTHYLLLFTVTTKQYSKNLLFYLTKTWRFIETKGNANFSLCRSWSKRWVRERGTISDNNKRQFMCVFVCFCVGIQR